MITLIHQERKAIFQIFLNRFLVDQEAGEARQNTAARIIMPNYRSSLTDAYTTHKQTITINGKNVRVTIPAGVENGQKIKIKGLW